MDIFLRAKHWQLFVLTFGIPLVLQFILMFSIFSQLAQHTDVPPDPVVILGYFKFFPLIMILFIGTLLGWQWSVAVGLQRIIPPGIKMKVTKFKTFFFIPVVYMGLILVFVFYLFSISRSRSEIVDFGFYIFIPFMIIIPLHLFAMFCLFYCIYFVAKTLKTVELQRDVAFTDFLGEFFLTWFFPIGIWILQPRINKIIEDRAPIENL